MRPASAGGIEMAKASAGQLLTKEPIMSCPKCGKVKTPKQYCSRCGPLGTQVVQNFRTELRLEILDLQIKYPDEENQTNDQG